ncbi:MAG: hypothetical protein JWO87_1266 [Phycisphaerales bacterium]|nr:hypothetical protein [Phycisphaerales bacterium]MDB5303784.1 hypothetical protein [Phycisphaerales bacterium]
MRFDGKLAVALLGLGLMAAPGLVSGVRGADAPKDPPKEAPQPGRGGPTGFIERFHQSVLKLDLSDDQKPKVEAAFTEAKTKAEAAAKDAGDDRTAVRAKVRPIMDDLRKTVDGLLTPAQKDKLAKDRPQRGNGNGNGGAGNGQTPKQ